MTTPRFAPDAVCTALQDDPFWAEHLRHIGYPEGHRVALHLAILVNPYLQRLLNGQKTIESRFSVQRRAPYAQVASGDVVLLKRSGGPIMGIGLVAEPTFYELTPTLLQHIQTTYADALGIDNPAFWTERATAAFATLIPLLHVRQIPPIPFVKRDQRAWVVLQRRVPQPLFFSPLAHHAAD